VNGLTAFAACKENGLPIMVFDIGSGGNLMKVVQGENIGALVN